LSKQRQTPTHVSYNRVTTKLDKTESLRTDTDTEIRIDEDEWETAHARDTIHEDRKRKNNGGTEGSERDGGTEGTPGRLP
jgi:hypothetical protein